jgi:hypothetical protein
VSERHDPPSGSPHALIAHLDPQIRRAFHVERDGHITVDPLELSLENTGRIGLRERRGQRLTRADQALSDLLRSMDRHDQYIVQAADPMADIEDSRRRMRMYLRTYGRQAHSFFAEHMPGDYARVTPTRCSTSRRPQRRTGRHRRAIRRRSRATRAGPDGSGSDGPGEAGLPARVAAGEHVGAVVA